MEIIDSIIASVTSIKKFPVIVIDGYVLGVLRPITSRGPVEIRRKEAKRLRSFLKPPRDLPPRLEVIDLREADASSPELAARALEVIARRTIAVPEEREAIKRFLEAKGVAEL